MATTLNTSHVSHIKYFPAPSQTPKKKLGEIKKAIHRNHVKEEEELRKREEEKIKNEQKPEDAEIEVEPDLPPEQKLALLEAKLDELSDQKHKLFLLLKTILSEDEKKKQKEAEKRRLEEQQQQERMLAVQQMQVTLVVVLLTLLAAIWTSNKRLTRRWYFPKCTTLTFDTAFTFHYTIARKPT